MNKHVRLLAAQASPMPTRKVTAGALAGAVTIIGVYVARLFNVEVPGEVASSITTVLTFAAGYVVKDYA